jgi:hypothetical protein
MARRLLAQGARPTILIYHTSNSMQDVIHFVADEMEVTSDRISTEGLKADLPDHPGWTKCLQRAIRTVIPENVIQRFFPVGNVVHQAGGDSGCFDCPTSAERNEK